MHTEHLHQTLSPQAHAALLDVIHRQARRERRLAVQHFGSGWISHALVRVGRVASGFKRAAALVHPARA